MWKRSSPELRGVARFPLLILMKTEMIWKTNILKCHALDTRNFHAVTAAA